MSHISSLKKNAQLYINYFNPQIMCKGQLRLAKERNSSEYMTHLQMWKLNLAYRMFHHHCLNQHVPLYEEEFPDQVTLIGFNEPIVNDKILDILKRKAMNYALPLCFLK